MADEKGSRTTGSMPAVPSGGPPGRPSSSSASLPRIEIPREASGRLSTSSSALPRVEIPRETSSRFTTSSNGVPREIPRETSARLTSSSSNLPRVEVPREARIPLAAQVRLQYASILDFHESQSVNISRTGMFVAADSPAPVGTLVDFEFCLEDGLCLLKGKGEVVRITPKPTPGMGLRFRQLDEESRKCIARIVEINEQEGRAPSMPLDFDESRPYTPRPLDAQPAMARSGHALHGATRVQPGLSVVGLDLHVRLTPLTAGYFTNNPLINIRLGGFVVPVDEEVSLGTTFDVAILDNEGISLFQGKGKVVAKDGRRIGIRLSDIAKPLLTRLQAEVTRLSGGK
jgi:uncharacterized protein (TIGR02266 family)